MYWFQQKNQRSHRKRQNVASSLFSFSQNIVAIRIQKHVQIGELNSAPVIENFDKKKTFFAGEANAPSTVKVASFALSKANLRWWAILKLLF